MFSSIFSPLGLYSALDSKTKCRAQYSALQVYIQRQIRKPNVGLYIRLSRSIFSTIFNIRMQSSIFGPPCLMSIFSIIFKICMQSSIFGPPGLFSALYSTSESRALYSAAQVDIQHYIQHPNVELCISALQVYIQRYIQKPNVEVYIQPSRSIFSARFKNPIYSSIFGPPGLYSALQSSSECRALYSTLQDSPDSAIYSTLECRALYSALQVYFQRCIQHPNVEFYIRSYRSIFSTIFKTLMWSSLFGPPGLHSALFSTSECRALFLSARPLLSTIFNIRMQSYIFSPPSPQVYIKRFIQKPNVEFYIRSSRSILSARFKNRMQTSIFSPPGLYSALYSTSECRALYSALQVCIEHSIQHPNIELYIRLSRSILSTIFKIRMQSSIFGPPGLYSALYSKSECGALYSARQVYFQHFIQHLNVELYFRLSRSIFSTILNIRMQSSIFRPPGLY